MMWNAMLPVVHRELLAASRRSGTYHARVGTALIGLVPMVWIYLISGASAPASSLGKSLFTGLSILAFVFSLLAGTWLTSDCVSSEKREGTLGLLFLTDLNGFDILIGKLVSSSFAAFYGLLAIVPLLAIAILMGGVTLGEVGMVAMLLANTMFFSLSAGLFASTLTPNGRKALYATVLLIFSASIWPLLAMMVCQALEKPLSNQEGILLAIPSPVFSCFISPVGGDGSLPHAKSAFLSSLAFVHLEAWLLLLLASRWLPYLAFERSKSFGRRGWAWRWRNWSFGEGEGRLRYRRKLLDRNAFFWLAAREQRKPIHVWLMLSTILGLWLLAAWRYPNYFATPETCFGLGFVIQGILKIWFSSEVCVRLNEDRHSGGLELLLSTPLTVAEIARGQAAALRRQFLAPMLFVLFLEGAFVVAMWRTAHTVDTATLSLAVAAGMLCLPLDLWALRWAGMWRALTQPKLDRALLGTWGQILVLPWVVYAGVLSSKDLVEYMVGRWLPTDSRSALALWTLLNLAIVLAFGLWARRRFLSSFRVVATAHSDNPEASDKSALLEFAKQILSRRNRLEVPPLRRVLRQHPWIIGGTLVLVALALTGGVMRKLARSRFEKEVDQVRQRGEPLSRADLTSTAPALKGRNQADQLIAQFPRMRRLNQFKWSGVRDATNSAQRATSRGSLTEAERARYSEAVEANSSILQAVRAIDDFRQTEFQIPLDGVFNLGWGVPPQQQWWQTVALSELVEAEALLQIDAGDREEGVTGVSLELGLANMLENVPVNHAQASRFRVLHRAVVIAETLLSSSVPTLKELGILETLVKDAEAAALDPTPLRRALFLDRVQLIVLSQSSSTELAARFGPMMGGLASTPLAFALTKWSGRWDLMAAQGVHDQTAGIDLLNLPLHSRQEQILNIESEIKSRPEVGRVFVPFQEVLTTRLLTAQMEAITRLRAGLVAIAIERSRLLSNAPPPATLEELVPRVLEKIPLDPFDGQPLRYFREADGPGYLVFGMGGQVVRQGSQNAPPPNRSKQLFFRVER